MICDKRSHDFQSCLVTSHTNGIRGYSQPQIFILRPILQNVVDVSALEASNLFGLPRNKRKGAKVPAYSLRFVYACAERYVRE